MLRRYALQWGNDDGTWRRAMLRHRSGLKSEKEKCAQLTITDGAAQSTDAWDSLGTERETSPVPGQYTTDENFSRDISYTCAVCHQTIYGVPFTSLAGGPAHFGCMLLEKDQRCERMHRESECRHARRVKQREHLQRWENCRHKRKPRPHNRQEKKGHTQEMKKAATAPRSSTQH